MTDDLGDRCKSFELREAGRRLMPGLPTVARIDGRRFSRFTGDLARPYDERLSKLMVDVTRALVEETAACCGYTQSDEISLVWPAGLAFCDGKAAKATSLLASYATVVFNRNLPFFFDLGDYAGRLLARLPHFDARVWAVPDEAAACEVLHWRELDATKNAVSMAARAYFSHNRLHGLGSRQMQELLFQEKGVNFNDYPAFFRRGTFVRRKKVKRKFTAEEIDRLPAKHEARSNPNLEIERTDLIPETLPRFGSLLNQAGVVFRGEEPQVAVRME